MHSDTHTQTYTQTYTVNQLMGKGLRMYRNINRLYMRMRKPRCSSCANWICCIYIVIYQSNVTMYINRSTSIATTNKLVPQTAVFVSIMLGMYGTHCRTICKYVSMFSNTWPSQKLTASALVSSVKYCQILLFFFYQAKMSFDVTILIALAFVVHYSISLYCFRICACASPEMAPLCFVSYKFICFGWQTSTTVCEISNHPCVRSHRDLCSGVPKSIPLFLKRYPMLCNQRCGSDTLRPRLAWGWLAMIILRHANGICFARKVGFFLPCRRAKDLPIYFFVCSALCFCCCWQTKAWIPIWWNNIRGIL